MFIVVSSQSNDPIADMDVHECLVKYEDITKLTYFTHVNTIRYKDDVTYYLLEVDEENKKLKGGVQFDIKYHLENERVYWKWISSVAVTPQYIGQGLSKQLVKNFFEFASKHKFENIIQSSYTEAGKSRIMKYFRAYKEEYPEVKFFDKERDI